MAKPQVTITLGRSGQRVVKESRGDPDRRRANPPMPSGNKRSLAESFPSRADHSHYHSRKRMREDETGSSYGYNSQADDSRLGSEDLRLKLVQKRLSKRAEVEIEERKKKELYDKFTRAIESEESLRESHLRNITSSRGAAEPLQKDSNGTSYAYRNRTTTEVRARSPDRLPRSSSGISTPRTAIDELPWMPSIGIMDCSRTGRILMSDPLDSSRPRVTLPTNLREPLDSGNLVRQHPPATVGLSSFPYPDTQPLTVSTLLESLGLTKYSIHFQHEEIDMVALRQMGERDLKDLGIPMGPRKKILLALAARVKRQAPQVRSNYLR